MLSVVFYNNNFIRTNHYNNIKNTIIIRYIRTKPLQRLPVPRQTKRLDCVIIGEPNAGNLYY